MDYGSWARPVDQEQQRQQPFQLPLKIIILPSKIQYYTINTLDLPSKAKYPLNYYIHIMYPDTDKTCYLNKISLFIV